MALKTLRDVSGLGTQPPALGSAALVMVDCQNTYREGVMQLIGVEPALKEAQRLLQRARAGGVPVFHIQHDAGAGSPYDLAERIGQISAEVAPIAGEAVVTKRFPNAFVQTELEQKLHAAGVTDVILVGFMTHMCISSTARGAFNLGFRPTVVASATATRDLPGVAEGDVVPAASLQAASLTGLRDLFAVVVPSTAGIAD